MQSSVVLLRAKETRQNATIHNYCQYVRNDKSKDEEKGSLNYFFGCSSGCMLISIARAIAASSSSSISSSSPAPAAGAAGFVALPSPISTSSDCCESRNASCSAASSSGSISESMIDGCVCAAGTGVELEPAPVVEVAEASWGTDGPADPAAAASSRARRALSSSNDMRRTCTKASVRM